MLVCLSVCTMLSCVHVGRLGVQVRSLDSHSTRSGFESFCCRFVAWANSFSPYNFSSLSCINEYLANSLRAVNAALLKTRVGVEMNRSARGEV